jgi:pyruvate,water dikinase
MSDATFSAPGPGQWNLDRSHYPGGTTPISQWLIEEAAPAGLERVFAEVGVPLRTVHNTHINGFNYSRVIPLVGGDKAPRKPPPAPILKLLARLHPEFRRRAAAAAKTFDSKEYLAVAERWEREMQPELVATNTALQRIDLDALDDDALGSHIRHVLDHARSTFELHFWLHGHDLGPIARLLHRCEAWGIPGEEIAAALAGASPSTTAPMTTLCRLRELIETSDTTVDDLDGVRQVSPEAAQLLDDYLERRGGVLATGYDITSATLGEMPGMVLDSILTARQPESADGSVTAALRDRVPMSDQDEFDTLLVEARRVMDMRDDNGPLTIEWPAGLLRTALLTAGRRVADRGELHDATHALELTVDEACSVLRGGIPSADAIAARRERRLELSRLDPPVTIGPDEPEPPLDVLPGRLPEMVTMVQTALRHLGTDGTRREDGNQGVGVGNTAYTGRICRVENADEAFERLEPGDVLVVRATSPAFNVVLSMAGAVVTADGGALSHAAVLARELGIPAVVGAHAALDLPDGATLTVDPVEGRVALSS